MKSIHVCLLSLLFFMASPAFAQAQSVATLEGYSTLTVTPAFEAYLRNNPSIRQTFAKNPELSKKVMDDADLQQQLMDGNVRLNDLRRELAQQQKQKGGDVNTNYAERSGVSGNGRVADNLNVGGSILTGAAQADLGTQMAQTAEERQKAINTMLENLEKQNPAAYEALMANTALLQRLIDGEADFIEVLTEIDATAVAGEVGNSALDTTVEATAEQADETGQVNVNRVPTPEDMALDANGWPKYLGVPADCPAPKEDVARYFYKLWVVQEDFDNQPKIEGPRQVDQSGFFSGSTTHVALTEEQQFSVPFFTVPGRGFHPGFSNSEPQFKERRFDAYWGWMEYAISHCPGDFSNTTPAGEEELSSGCQFLGTDSYGSTANQNWFDGIDVAFEDDKPNKTKSCVLRPAKKYFYNIRPGIRSEDPELRENVLEFKERKDRSIFAEHVHYHDGQYTPEGRPTTNTNKKGLPYYHGGRNGGGSSSGSRVILRLPYAGPEVTGQRHYPLNYTRGGNRANRTWHQPNCNAPDQIFKCYDTKDIGQPKTFHSKCINSNTMGWVEGYGESLTPSYACEYFASAEDAASDRLPDYQVPGASLVCAAHREGEVITYTPGSRYSKPYIIKTQCQFDEQYKQYAWVKIDQYGLNYHHMNFVASRRARKTEPAPAYRDKCRLNGSEYDIGATIQVSCDPPRGRSVKDTLQCQQRAEKPALPRLVLLDYEDEGTRWSTYREAVNFNHCEIKEVE